MEEYEARLGLLARRGDERKTLAKVYVGLKALHVNDAEAKNELLGLLAPLTGVEDTK